MMRLGKDLWEEVAALRLLLAHIDPDSTREGLEDTPFRVLKSWDEIFRGYTDVPKEILKTDFGARYDQMVLLKEGEFYSTCEHHMLPFFGVAHVAYIPKEKRVVGVSKLSRL